MKKKRPTFFSVSNSKADIHRWFATKAFSPVQSRTTEIDHISGSARHLEVFAINIFPGILLGTGHFNV